MTDSSSFKPIKGGAFKGPDGTVYRPFKAVNTNIMCDMTHTKVFEGGTAYLTKEHATIYQARQVIAIDMGDFYGDDEEDETAAQDEKVAGREKTEYADRSAGVGPGGDATGAETGSDAGGDRVQAKGRRTARR